MRFVGGFILLFSLFRIGYAQEAGVPLSVDEAVKLALAQNLDLQTSRDRVISTEISVETAKSEFRLNIRPDISGLYQQNDELDQNYGVKFSKRFTTGSEASWEVRTQVDDSEDEDEPYQTDVILAYTQPLLRGRGKLATTNQLVSAQEQQVIQRRNYLLTQQRLIVQVVASYYDIVRDQLLIGVHERAVERADLLKQAAEAKLKVGMASKMDVFRAELQLLNAQNRVVDARASFENALRRFNVLLGNVTDMRYTFVSALEYTPVELDQEELIRQALEHRLELQTARDRINEAERQLKIAKQNLLPPLDVSVRYTFRGTGEAFDQSWNTDDEFWGVGLSSSFDIDRAQERANYQQAQLTLNATLRDLQAAQDDIISEVMQTIVSVRQAQASVELQAQSVTQAEKQLELSSLRYKKGLSDNLEVVESEDNLMNAKNGYYSAVAQHLAATLRLRQVTGTLEVPSP
ncbi:hypothetical protein U14_01551 [Candidatus Moduliflexus flocculans]|uniref:Outer membrane efflux protein n=1 Tax=Candidatus Moduliflexus flocculans TaxID=1499966 RepID=A0A0S6VY36_9BACT|nr:hypothetical protein U14_01551 [Candidatus Moduliflexus flocculans]